MIAADCINCGACEPECPNNAISAGDPIYVIDPNLCTECVGFHDYEACAAVCPVDVCVTDPNNTETEETLIARARKLHPEENFGDTFESRFRKGEKKPEAAGTDAAEAADGGQPAVGDASSAQEQVSLGGGKVDLSKLSLPDTTQWEVLIQCIKCGEDYPTPIKHFMMGNVLFCPHCFKSMVVKDNLNFQIRDVLKETYEQWDRRLEDFQTQREERIKELQQALEREQKNLELEKEKVVRSLQNQLKGIAESYKAPGKPTKKRSLFGWG